MAQAFRSFVNETPGPVPSDFFSHAGSDADDPAVISDDPDFQAFPGESYLLQSSLSSLAVTRWLDAPTAVGICEMTGLCWQESNTAPNFRRFGGMAVGVHENTDAYPGPAPHAQWNSGNNKRASIREFAANGNDSQLIQLTDAGPWGLVNPYIWRFRVNMTTGEMAWRQWLYTDPEPSTWLLEHTAPSPGDWGTGFGLISGANSGGLFRMVHFSWIGVGTDGDPAPTGPLSTTEAFALRHNPRTNKVIPVLSSPTVTDIGAACVRPRVSKGY